VAGCKIFAKRDGRAHVPAVTGVPVARMTSGASATNSAADLRMRSASPAPHRYSSRTLRPSVHPSSCNPCKNAPTRASDSGSSAVEVISTPMRRIRSVAERMQFTKKTMHAFAYCTPIVPRQFFGLGDQSPPHRLNFPLIGVL
jgi:hypothetical protein